MIQKSRNFTLLVIVIANLMLFALFFINAYADEPKQVFGREQIRENIYASAILSDKEFLVIGDRGKIFRSVDGGKSWRAISSGTAQALFSVSFPDAKNGWISGKSGLILHTTDGGITWSKQESGVKKNLLSISFADAIHGCAVGDWGNVIITKDGGTTWQDASLKDDVVLYGVCFADSQHGWIIGEFGRIFSTVDGGKTWRLVPSPMEEEHSLFCLTINGESLYAAGIEGVILYSDNRGKSWQRAKNESKSAIYGIKVQGLTGWAVGDVGTILHTKDGGKSWQSVDVPEDFKLFWFCTVSLTKNNPEKPSGFCAGAHGLFLNIDQGKIR